MKSAPLWKKARLCGSVFLLGGALVAPAQAQVVINEVYGAGGNGGAVRNRDYVELFNAGTTAVDVTGYTVQYAPAATGSAFSTSGAATLSGVIPPGRFYLVAMAPAGTIGSAIPTPDAVGTSNLAASNGKVALATDNTAVTGPTSSNVVDYVAFGTGTPAEGTAAPAPTTTLSIERRTNGVDTNNNFNDFETQTPDPQNSTFGAAGPEVSFSLATATVSEGAGTLTLTVTRTSGTGAGTVDFAATSGTATLGTDFTLANGTVSFADGELSKTFPVSVADDSAIEGNETFTVTLSNASAGTTVGTVPTVTVTIRENDRAAGAILINEIKNDAPGNDGPQEYIELRGTPGAALTNVALVYVPGDSAFPTSLGTARQVVDLTGASFGSNGLLVIKSPTSGPTLPAATTIVTDTGFDAGTTGAFLNGTGTFLLVFTPNAPIVETTDYDTNNDGTFEAGSALALAERLDSVGFLDGNDGDITYSPAVLRLGSGSTGGSDTAGNNSPGAENAVPDAASRFPTNSTSESAGAFFFGELVGADNTVLDYDETAPGTTVSANFPTGYDLTPGAANTLPVVTPSGPVAYAAVGSSLYRFDVSSPGTAIRVGADGAIGFAPAGIDFNPATGELFAIQIGTPNTTLHTLSLSDGTASQVGTGFATTVAGSYDLAGQNLGFDFNPKTIQGDGSIRIRVTASNGTDLRLNANTGALANVDGALRVDGAGPNISIVGAGYTNNVAQQAGTGTTVLYDVSDTNDQLYIQNPPNNGTLVAATATLGVDAQAKSGFDIFTDASGTGNTAYLATDAGAGGAPSEFYTVDIAGGTPTAPPTGAATLVGSFPAGLIVDDIAVQPLGVADRLAFVQSITRSVGQSNPANGSSVSFTVTFSEAVTGVTADDFTLTQTGSTTGAVVSSISGSGATYTVVVSGFSGNGTLRLDVTDNDSILDGTSTPLAGTGTGTANPAITTGAGNGNFNTGEIFTIAPSATSGALISEFRFRGVTSTDEYVEIFNTTSAPLNISGWKLQTNTLPGNPSGTATPNIVTATVPQNTLIPARGHFLFTGGGYSLGAYSNLGSTPAQAVLSLGGDAADDSGAALLNADNAVQDAVGFASSTASLREAGALSSAPSADGTASNQHAFMRDFAGSGLKDTGNNAADFVLVSSNGASVPSNAGPIPAQLGAPNPESLSSPVNVNSQVVITLLQPEAGLNNAPNRLRTGSGNGGTLLLRRTIRNTGSQPLSRVRLLMTRITSQGSPTGIVPGTQADVRLISSGNESIALPNRDTNGVIIPAGQDGAGTTLTPVYAALLEAPSNATSTSGTPVVTGGGGGLGSSVVFDLTFPTPLLPNTSANYGFNLQVATGGTYLVAFNVLAVTN